MIKCHLSSISHRFRDTASRSRKPPHPNLIPQIEGSLRIILSSNLAVKEIRHCATFEKLHDPNCSRFVTIQSKLSHFFSLLITQKYLSLFICLFFYLFVYLKINDKRTRKPLILSDTEKYNMYTAQRNTKKRENDIKVKKNSTKQIQSNTATEFKEKNTKIRS